MNHLKILSMLLVELNSINNSDLTEVRFNEYIKELKNKTSAFNLSMEDNELNNHVLRLKNSEVLSDTSFFNRFFHRLAAIKYNNHMNDDWHNNGKYQYDLDRIKLLLEGLIFKLERTSFS